MRILKRGKEDEIVVEELVPRGDQKEVDNEAVVFQFEKVDQIKIWEFYYMEDSSKNIANCL